MRGRRKLEKEISVSGRLDTLPGMRYTGCKVNMTLRGGDRMRNRVKELREALGLTQKELGERAGVSRQAINAIETGKFDPSIWLAHDLSRLFQTSIEALFLFAEEDRK